MRNERFMRSFPVAQFLRSVARTGSAAIDLARRQRLLYRKITLSQCADSTIWHSRIHKVAQGTAILPYSAVISHAIGVASSDEAHHRLILMRVLTVPNPALPSLIINLWNHVNP
jgi:hypothetical protein